MQPTAAILAVITTLAFAPAISHGATATRNTLSIGKKAVPYYSNRPLTVPDPTITRAVIVIHGSGRKVAEYYDAIVDSLPTSANFSRDWRHTTIVLAPHFQEKSDAKKGEYSWKGDWSAGGNSGGLSSYKVVDELVARLRNGTFPNLKWIVITGHSAGGQFVQRYAAFTDIDQLPVTNAALVKFVPSNPSSYVYLNDYRFSETEQDWVIPRGKKNKAYDEYKYGLDDLEDYAKTRGPDWARTHLPQRWVELLAGTSDIETDGSFDDSKEAMWQGDTRYERAQRFDAFMDRFFNPNRFSVTPVPKVGHDHREIYLSAQAQAALYFPDGPTAGR
jgi:pimeloyl-ACP methyl ester carboxylesterase